LDVALKTQKQENQKTGGTSRAWARGARSRLEMPVASVFWRGARTGWRQAQLVRVCADFVEKFVSESIWFGFCFIL
jgi:hypothetical protein